ncbi:MAG: multiprotein bridging factor aMBF1, partial [Candidatus Lokiarchaeota archaeon]
MPKQESSKEDICPICGGVIWGGGEKVLIEGAKIRVCQSCAQHGKKIVTRSKKSRRAYSSRMRTKKATQKTIPKYTPSKNEDLVVVSDYSNRIRNARNMRNLTQEKFAQQIQEKESLLRRIEAAKTKPTLKLAKKLEKALDIKLLEQADEVVVDTKKFMKRTGGSSLGDIA